MVHGQQRDGRRRPGRHPATASRPPPARARVRRGDRVRRPRQRRRQPHRRRPLRLPAAVGARRGERDGRAGPVPVRQARARHRRLAAGRARAADAPRAAAGVLGAGRGGRGGHRHRRGGRRRDRPAPAVRGAAAARRADRRRRVACSCWPPRTGTGSGAFEHVIVALLAVITIGFLAGLLVSPARRARRPVRPGPAVRRHRLGPARRLDARRHRHAARDLRALGPGARPPRTHHRARRSRDAPAVDPLGRRHRAGRRRRREHRPAAAGRVRPARRRPAPTRSPAPTTRSSPRSASASASRSPSACWRPAWPPRRSARTRARRSWRG